MCEKCGLAMPHLRANRDGMNSGGSQPVTDYDPQRAMLVGGWLCAVLPPPVGFVVGIILAAKGRPALGIGMMIVSLVVGVFWLAMLALVSGA